MSRERSRVVAFDATPLEVPRPAGVGRYTAQLLGALLAHPQAPPIALLAGRRLASSVQAGTLGRWGPQVPNRTIWMQVVLPRVLARARPRLCHFTNSIAPFMAPCPYVLTIHDMSLFLFARMQAPRHLIAARGIVPVAARRAAMVVAVSESARQDIIQVLELPPARVRVVYSAAAPEFRPIDDARERERVRVKYSLAEPFVLHVGTIEPRKNLRRLVEAAARLRGEGRPERLVLAGQLGWKYGGLLRQIGRARLSPLVRVLDYVDAADLPVLYNLARAVALPSLYEGFGLPVLEAMATGAPVLTSNRSAMAEIGADAALLVDPESTDALAEGLRQILDDDALRRQLRERGFRRAAQFSWHRAATETLRIYEEVSG